MTEIGINPGQMRWGKGAGYARGTRICSLRTDQSGMVRAFLLRAGQDFTMEGHTNMTSDQQFVLEGEIHSGGQIFWPRFLPVHPAGWFA